jgi:hypothetical protein
MARKRGGKKGKGQNKATTEKATAGQGRAGVAGVRKSEDEPLTSCSSDDELDYKFDDASLGSKNKSGGKKQKGKSDPDDIEPPLLDLTGLPDNPATSPPKHNLRSASSHLEDSGKMAAEQDADDANVYDLTQVEVIDVDADEERTDERTLRRYKVGKAIWDKYGSDLEIFAGTANFLLFAIGNLVDDTTAASASTKTDKSTKYVNHFGPFTIVLLFYMRSMAYSQLFQALTLRNLPKFISGCQFNSRTLTWKAQF